jgi:aryl-alcohol dehydrogenase-like predicted oxidoreductase
MKALAVSERYGLTRYVCQQVNYNLIARDVEHEIIPLALDQQVGVMAWSPLHAGLLTGKFRRGQPIPEGTRVAERGRDDKRLGERLWTLVDEMERIGGERGATIPQIAVAWTSGAPAITSSIIGATSVAQLEDTLGAAGLELSGEERARLDELSDWREQ